MSRILYGIAGGFAVLVGLAAFAGIETTSNNIGSDSGKSSLASQPPDITTTAPQLFADYQANEIAADEKYKNRIIQVSGNIDTIGKDVTDSIYVTLSSDEEIGIFNVQLFFSDAYEKQTAMLQKGEVLDARCRCDGKFGNVMLKECVIESVSGAAASN